MRAAPADQLRLLDLQAIDLHLDQLAHRRRTLPELAELQQGQAALGGIRDDVVRARTEIDDLDREIRRLESDIDQVRQRARRDQQRMDSGAITASKELESLQHEVASLARRQSELEDAELELMEQREEAQGALDSVDTRLAKLREERAAAEQRRDETLREINAEEERQRAERGPLVAALPEDLVTLYEKIREQSGMGAAMLRARRCEGCRLELSGVELTRFRSAAGDEVLRCDECRRILVRTAESGL